MSQSAIFSVKVTYQNYKFKITQVQNYNQHKIKVDFCFLYPLTYTNFCYVNREANTSIHEIANFCCSSNSVH